MSPWVYQEAAWKLVLQGIEEHRGLDGMLPQHCALFVSDSVTRCCLGRGCVKATSQGGAKQIAEAREKGDLSENAEYDAAKEAQGLLELRIARLENELGNARLLDESKIDPTKIMVLSKIKIKHVKLNRVLNYMIVSEQEADLKKGRISISSPIAKGLLGKRGGDKVAVVVPAGTVNFEVLEVNR